MRRNMNRNYRPASNSGGGHLMTNNLELQDLDHELELLKRKRQIIEQQHQMLTTGVGYMDQSRQYGFNQPQQNYQGQSTQKSKYSPYYNDSISQASNKYGSILGKRQSNNSDWNSHSTPKRFTGASKGPKGKYGADYKNHSPWASNNNQGSSKNSPWSDPRTLMGSKINPPKNKKSFNKFNGNKVSKPAPSSSFVNKLVSYPIPQRKTLVEGSANLVQNKTQSLNAEPSLVLRADKVPTPKMAGRLELALGNIMKDVKTQYGDIQEYKLCFISNVLMRNMKQTIRERLRNVLLNKPIGNVVEIVNHYRKVFPQETDIEILNAAQEFQKANNEKQNAINLEYSDCAIKYFKDNMNKLITTTLEEMFAKLEELYPCGKEVDKAKEMFAELITDGTLLKVADDIKKCDHNETTPMETEFEQNKAGCPDQENSDKQNEKEQTENEQSKAEESTNNETEKATAESEFEEAKLDEDADKSIHDNENTDRAELNKEDIDKPSLHNESDDRAGLNKEDIDKPSPNNESADKPSHEKEPTDKPSVDNEATHKPGPDNESTENTDQKLSENEIEEQFNKIDGAICALLKVRLPVILGKHKNTILKILNLSNHYRNTKEVIMSQVKELVTTECRIELSKQKSDSEKEKNDSGDVNNSKNTDTSISSLTPDSLLHYVKIVGRPYLPKRRTMQNYLKQFYPKSIKKHKSLHLLFVGFDDKKNYDAILAVKKTDVGNMTILISRNDPKNSNDDSPTAVKAAETTSDKLNESDPIMDSQLDEQIDDLLQSIRYQEDEATKATKSQTNDNIKVEVKGEIVAEVAENKDEKDKDDVEMINTAGPDSDTVKEVVTDNAPVAIDANEQINEENVENTDAGTNDVNATDNTAGTNSNVKEEELKDKLEPLKSETKESGRATPTRSSSRLSNATPSTIRTRRASRLAQN